MRRLEIIVPRFELCSLLTLGNRDRRINYYLQALKIDPNNLKALYNRGEAYYYLKDFEEAKKDLVQASKLDPKDAKVLSCFTFSHTYNYSDPSSVSLFRLPSTKSQQIKKTLKVVTEQLEQVKQKEKKMYSKMFG